MYIIDTNLQPVRIYLNSKNYSSKLDTYNNYFYQLNETIRKYSNMDILLKLESFTFTNTIYNINDTNANFNYSFNGVGLGAVFNVRITNGNYSIDDLIINLNIRCSGNLNFTFNSATLKITITSLRENFRLVEVDKSIYKVLGFTNSITDNLYNSVTSPSIINLNTNTNLNIILENIRFQSNSVKNQSINIFENIPIISSFGEVQTYIANNNFQHLIDNDNINSISINILNQDFQPVYFNNSNWYIVISVEFMYKKELKIPENYFNPNSTLYNSLRDELIELKKNEILSEK